MENKKYLSKEIEEYLSKGKEERFLSSAAIDYVALSEIVRMDAPFYEFIPSEEEFLEALEFIEYLFQKYGKDLSYSIGPGDPLDKTPEELMLYMKEMFYAGKYKDIYYSIWFDLELSAIPPEYIPPPLEKEES